MTNDSAPRRASDPEDFNGRQMRGDGVEAGFGNYRVKITGTLGMMILMLAAIAVAFVWQSWDRRTEHVGLADELKVMRCYQSFVEADRAKLRTLSMADLAAHCPWLWDTMRREGK